MNNYPTTSKETCCVEAVPSNYTMASKLADIRDIQSDAISALITMHTQMFGQDAGVPNKKECKCMDNAVDEILDDAWMIRNGLLDLMGRIGI